MFEEVTRVDDDDEAKSVKKEKETQELSRLYPLNFQWDFFFSIVGKKI